MLLIVWVTKPFFPRSARKTRGQQAMMDMCLDPGSASNQVFHKVR